eukprot:Colp12_sorted_trinity150504_noHs@22582
MKATRLYTDEKGESHFEDFEIELEDAGDIGRLSKLYEAKGVIFRETPGSYDFTWHNAPKRQFVIMLSGGGVEMTASDGEVRRFYPGDITLLEDTTGKGHISKAIDGKSRVSIFIQLE